MGVPKPINLLDPKVGALIDTDLFPSRAVGAPPAQKTTMLELATYIASKLLSRNGVSKDLLTGLITQLGQDVGTAGDPAALFNDVEIPNAGGFTVFFGKNDGVSDVVGINSQGGIDISNAAGDFLALFSNGVNYTVTSPAPGELLITMGTQNLDYNNATKALTWDDVFGTEGLRISNTPTVAAVINATQKDSVFLIDSTAGNVVVNLDPAVIGKNIQHFKKTSADANTITLTPASGTIQEIGAPAATFVFNVQGESITVYCDGTNFFIL